MNYSKKETSKKQKALRSKKKKVGKKLGVIFLKAFLVCMIAVVVVVGCAGIGIIKGVIDNAPDITSESVIPKGYKSTVYDSEGNKMQELIASGTNRTMVTIDQIPKHVQNAFIAIEDERFYEHNGIDIQGIARAGVTFVTSGFNKMQGASTITQQLLKNNVFTDWMEEETLGDKISRKIQEQYLAICLEQKYSKEWILENYLNTINLGGGTRGVQVAARYYFGKDVSELTLAESTLIAGITKNPTKYNPLKHPDKSLERQQLVLNAMLKQELISEEEYEAAKAENVLGNLITSSADRGVPVFSWFEDALLTQIVEDLMEKYGYDESQAWDLLYSGGLTIHSTQDSRLQDICEEQAIYSEHYTENANNILTFAKK